MHLVAHIALPILSLTAFATAAIAADVAPVATPASSAVDLSSIYSQVAVAKAKAELSVQAMSQDVDSRRNGSEAARDLIESCRQKASSKYESLRQAEEKRGEMKDEAFMDACGAALDKLSTDHREVGGVTKDLDARLEQARKISDRLRQAYESAETIERSFKEAQVDLAVVLQLFTLIDSKAAEASKDSKAAAAAYVDLAKPWQDALSAAEIFTK